MTIALHLKYEHAAKALLLDQALSSGCHFALEWTTHKGTAFCTLKYDACCKTAVTQFAFILYQFCNTWPVSTTTLALHVMYHHASKLS